MAAFTSFAHWEQNFDSVMYRYAKYQQQSGTKLGHDQLNSITEEVTSVCEVALLFHLTTLIIFI